MNIQSLNTSALAGIALQRPPDVAAEMPGATSQTTSPPVQIQQVAVLSAEQGKSVNREQLTVAVNATSEFVASINRSLEFSIDEDTGTSVVKIVDKETDELIRQIPSEEMLAIAKALDTIKGLLLHQKA